MFQKKKGESTITGMISVLFTVVIICVISMIYAQWQTNFQQKDNIDLTCRNCILMMETKGYMDATMKSNLRTKLASYSLENIDFSGTTESPVARGSKMTLSVTGEMVVRKIDITGLLSISITDDRIPIHIVDSCIYKGG